MVAHETLAQSNTWPTKGLPIYPQTIETYNAFVKYLVRSREDSFIIIDVQNILVETGFETEKALREDSYL